MRKLNYVFAFFLIGLLGFSACDSIDEIDTLLGKMTAKIDGKAWSVSTTDGTGLLGAVIADDKFIITATDVDGKSLVIVINGTETNKSYDLAVLDKTASAVTIYKENADDDSADGYLSTAGSVTLTEKSDNRISGTFYFTAAKSVDETIEITDGSFDNILYTNMDDK